MSNFLENYQYFPDMEIIGKQIDTIQSNLEYWLSPEILTKCLSMIDLTSLHSTDTMSDIAVLVEKVNNFKGKFPKYPYPASICVYPNFSETIKSKLTAEGVHITVVSGGFPTSQTYKEVKCLESELAVKNGADEVDIVLALNKFLDNDFDACTEEIKAIKSTIGDKTLKVILETGALGSAENIAHASFLAMEAGADFIKTSTGKLEPAATPMAAVVMCECIKRYYEKTGRQVGFKPAGGMKISKDAACYYAIADTILGEKWLNNKFLRFGASRVTNNILSDLEESTITYY